MQNFQYFVPTTIAFGKGEIEKLPEFILKFGKRVLLVYGGGSIKTIGLYNKIIQLLDENGIIYYELAGVEPNPQITTVEKGVNICRCNGIEAVVPIGGGSTIDCAKAVAAAVFYRGTPWDMIIEGKLKKALPIIAVLTIAATGSEMDPYAVISNEKTKDKKDIGGEVLFPRYSILDPTYTYSVTPYQTASGTADIMSHVFEVYFTLEPDNYLMDRVMEGILKTCVHFGPIACRNPEDYGARANLMWASSLAINGLISCGSSSPWPCHAMEHQLSAYYNVTHGHGLAVLTPAWMEYSLNKDTVELFAQYGKAVFGLTEKKIADKMSLAVVSNSL